MTWVIEYQVEPDFHVGQLVPHEEPVTVPETVTLLESPSEVLIVELVEAPVRRFAPEHAGDMVSEDAEMGATPMSTSIAAARNAVSHREWVVRPFVAELFEARVEVDGVVGIGWPWWAGEQAGSTTQQGHPRRRPRS